MTDRRRRCTARSRNGHRCHLRANHDGAHNAFGHEFTEGH